MKGDTLENYNEYKKNNIVSENIFWSLSTVY